MLLVDTSALLANYDRGEPLREAVAEVLRRPLRRILSPFVLAELDYMLAQAGGEPAELPMLQDVAEGRYELAPFDAWDVAAAIQVIERYSRLNVGLADASIVVLAERLKCLDLLTLDQRHFRAITGPGGRPFRILPFDE
jgi:predicted nucleic acid-binding protein